MNAPRPLVVGLGWPPDTPGGLERYVADLHRALSRRTGTPPHTIVLGPAADPPPGVHPVSAMTAALPDRLWALAGSARRWAPETAVVDVHFALTGAAALADRRTRSLPRVAHFHGPWALEAAARGDHRLAGRLRVLLERRVLVGAGAVVVLSGAMARTAVEHAGVSPWIVAVITPGVDLAAFTPGDRRDARTRLDLPTDGFVAVTARRLVPRTGVDVLFDAWADVLAVRPDAVLAVAGEGPAGAALARHARRVDGDVRLLGKVDDSQLRDLYRAADVSVVPSVSLEGFGLVALESLACATPVVVTDVGGLPEAVGHLDRSLVVAAADPAALGARLAEAASGSRPLPSAARCRAHAERFSWDDVADRHVELYRLVRDGSSDTRRRVVLLDHCARRSGGEIAAARLVSSMPAERVHTVLFEDGPLGPMLTAAGATHEVRPLRAAVRDLPRGALASPLSALRAGLSSLWFTLGLARRLSRLRPDVVHANSLKAGLIGGFAARLARLPFVWHVRDRLTPDYLPATAVAVVRALLPRLADGIVVPSATVARTLGPIGTDPTRLAIVPDPYRRRRPATPTERTAGEQLRIVVVGRLAAWKGQDLALRGFAAAFPTGGAHLTVVGDQLFGDGSRDDLVALADDLGVAERVHFAGHVDDVEAELDLAHVLVHVPVLPEPFGQVVVEAMAAGLAVVAAETGGPAELITHDHDGVLVAPGDPTALARALRDLEGDEARRRDLGSNARTTAERSADPDTAALAVGALYDRAIEHHRGARR